jgi:DNA-binding transcriptional LysR family regulator
MDTRHMRLFVALGETLHFGRAAARMHMSQPPFSRQIAAIERELGARLVERTTRNVALTPAGRRFLDDSRAVLAAFDDALRDARLVAGGMKGELRLGFMMHAGQGVVPRLVRRYTEERPEIRLILEETVPFAIEPMLLDGRLDAAVSFLGHPTPHIEAIPIYRDRLCLIAPPGHALAARDRITAADLANQPLITAPATVAPTVRDAIAAWCATGGIVPNFALEPRLQQTIISLVAEGLGIALIPESLTATLPPGLVARPLEQSPELPVALLIPTHTTNPAVAPLADLARHLASA